MRNLLSKYTDADVKNVPENVQKAADRFVDMLVEAAEKRGYGTQNYVKVVPIWHLSGRHDDRGLGIIYEECCDLAEQIQLGYPSVMDHYEECRSIEMNHGVMFECYNHWSTCVYED